jgi:hypothetical protein
MSAKFTKRSIQPLRDDSYAHAARRIRALAELIELEPITPRHHAIRTKAINDLSKFARRFAHKHSIGRGGY